MKALHSSADLWFGRLSLSTKVVAVGLFFEAPELIFEIWAIIRRAIDKYRFHITFPERHAPDWVKVVAFLGWILIVGGVVGEWFTEGRINEADTNIQELNDALANTIAAKASQARAWVLRTRPRYTFFDSNKFVESLNGVPPEKVEILYERENEEAYTLAFAISLALGTGKGNAGWDVSGPRPVTEKDALFSRDFGSHPENVPLIMRAGGSGGVGIIAKSIPPNLGKGAIGASALENALANSGAFGELHMSEANMSDSLIRIVIGKQID